MRRRKEWQRGAISAKKSSSVSTVVDIAKTPCSMPNVALTVTAHGKMKLGCLAYSKARFPSVFYFISKIEFMSFGKLTWNSNFLFVIGWIKLILYECKACLEIKFELFPYKESPNIG